MIEPIFNHEERIIYLDNKNIFDYDPDEILNKNQPLALALKLYSLVLSFYDNQDFSAGEVLLQHFIAVNPIVIKLNGTKLIEYLYNEIKSLDSKDRSTFAKYLDLFADAYIMATDISKEFKSSKESK